MLLLFDAKHNYLGEVSLTPEGSLQSIILSSRGDAEIGATVALWQTKGIAVEQYIGHKDSETGSFYVERIQPRQPGFKQAFRSWAEKTKIALVEVESQLVGFWEMLLRLSLTPSERFTYLLGVCRTPKNKLKEWEALLNQVQYDGVSTQSKRALNKLKVKLAKEMTNSLCDVGSLKKS